MALNTLLESVHHCSRSAKSNQFNRLTFHASSVNAQDSDPSGWKRIDVTKSGQSLLSCQAHFQTDWIDGCLGIGGRSAGGVVTT